MSKPVVKQVWIFYLNKAGNGATLPIIFRHFFIGRY